MTYKTHKAGGTLALLLGFTIMNTEKGRTMLPMLNQIHPVWQLCLMYPSCSWGSVAPDLDLCWENVKEKTPVNLLVHKILHLRHLTHRSKETHDILKYILFFIPVLYVFYSFLRNSSTNINITLLFLWLLGLILGIFSHLFLDMLNGTGIWLGGLKHRALVPKWRIFKTDEIWESFIYTLLMFSTILVSLNLVSFMITQQYINYWLIQVIQYITELVTKMI